MCLMLKRMETSKVQMQINTQIWSSCLWRFVILVMLILVGHFVAHFDKMCFSAQFTAKKGPGNLTPNNEVFNGGFAMWLRGGWKRGLERGLGKAGRGWGRVGEGLGKGWGRV